MTANELFITLPPSIPVLLDKVTTINFTNFTGILDRGAKYRDVYNFALDHIEKKNEILPNTRIMPYYRDINSNPILISQRGKTCRLQFVNESELQFSKHDYRALSMKIDNFVEISTKLMQSLIYILLKFSFLFASLIHF